MKKFLFISLLLISIILTSLIMINNKKDINEEYYTIVEAKGLVYEDDRSMNIDVYSNNPYSTYLLNDSTYTLKLGLTECVLDNINVEKHKINDDNYKYIITSNIPKISYDITNNATLLIRSNNKTLNLTLGIISIINPTSYTLLSFDDLYGVYNLYNNIPIFVGLQLKTTNPLTIDKLYGCIQRGDLSNVVEKKIDNETNILSVIPNYNINTYLFDTSYTFSKLSLIPLVYEDIMICNTTYIILKSNDTNYYIDQFTYRSNEFDYFNQNITKSKGVITYA